MTGSPIKLFVDAHAFDREYQGTQTFIRELYRALINDHPELDIYWGVGNVEKLRAVFPAVKPSHILPYKKLGAGLLRFVVDIPAYIKKYRFDFAHFQYLCPARQAGCTYIVTTHDILFNDFVGDFSLAYRLSRAYLFRKSILDAGIKTTVSNYSKQRISAHYHIPLPSVHVIPNGVEPGQMERGQAQAHISQKYGIGNFILYVSRVEHRKNHVLLLQTYLKLELYKQNIALVFIGHPSQSNSRLSQIINKLTPQQGALIHWFRQVDQADLQHFYAACRLFVYPSKAEGFGIPPLEAAVAGAPVLCSDATAMADFDFFKPYTFNPANGEQFEAKLLDMISHPPTPAFIEQVAQKIKNVYQWQHSSQLFYNLLIAN